MAKFAVDLLGPLSGGECLLVLVDYYSRYFEVDMVKTTKTEIVIQCLDAQFSRHGIPLRLRSDNGPPFNSSAFSEFLRERGITHLRNTPLWPRSNGEVECQNRSLMKIIRAAVVEKKDLHCALNEFLLAYRTTPHPATERTPAALLFNRELGTKLPVVADTFVPDQVIRDRDAEYKQRMKDTADDHQRAADQDVHPGDKVFLRRSTPPTKGESLFLPEPATIVDRHGDQVVVETSDGVQRRRSIHYTKPFVEPVPARQEAESMSLPEVEQQPPTPTSSCEEGDQPAQPKRMSSRVRQPPVWTKDYVM